MPINKASNSVTSIYDAQFVMKGDEVVFGTGVYIDATGGTISYDDGYKIHSFTTTGTGSFVVNSNSTSDLNNQVEYLIQGGGGSGARTPNATTFASAGGAGAMRTGSYSLSSNGTFEVIVGAGGTNPGGTFYNGENGKNSSIFGITACSGSGGLVDTRGGGNCDFSGSNAGPINNGNGASNQANATDPGGATNTTIQSGSIQDITGTPTEYGRGGIRYNQYFESGIRGAGGNGGNGSNDSTVGNAGIVIVRYPFR